jgi:uncharacterized protein with ParB-like and HNH nuclease domain
MNHDLYKLKDFLTNRNLNQIIIPEIQRDYVWQKDNVEKFLESLSVNSKRQKDKLPELTEEMLRGLPPEDRDCLIRNRKNKENDNNCQMGFIYAYQATSEGSDNNYILIDGQQRITTLFLTLLALSVKEKRQDDFRMNYFKDEVLKLDYKVRESSHEFLQKFVPYILAGKSIADISHEYWNFAEYQNDMTIKSIIANYIVIKDFIDTHDLSLNYVENCIEFWYYDTSRSDQGERLYLYMNSRGETVSPNESIKANLLRDLTSQEKHNWGTKWEHWQNLFWKYRKENPNADKGMDEFLKWIKFIELTKAQVEQPVSRLAHQLETIKLSGKINLSGLSLEEIESYYNAIEKLIKINAELNFNTYWLTGHCEPQKPIPVIDYIKLIPMLMYVKQYPDSDTIEIKRFARFFLNIARFETISKNSYNSVVDVIHLTNRFLEKGFKDITEITYFADKYKNILSDEEVKKLKIYKQSSNDLRSEIECAFWEAEDFKFCDGKVWLIWECINYGQGGDYSCFDSQNLSEFKDCFDSFKILFDNPTDLVRRALLTKGVYLIRDGYSTFLKSPRYSFIKEEKRWKESLSSREGITPYKLLIKDFKEKKKKINDGNKILEEIIDDFLRTAAVGQWRYYFVKNPFILEYCEKKMICVENEYDYNIENIVLLKSNKVTENNYIPLKDFVNLYRPPYYQND